MANRRRVFVIDERLDGGLSGYVGRLKLLLGKKYDFALFSETRKSIFYQKLSPIEVVERIIRKDGPEIVLYELLGDYLANSYNLEEGGRKAGFISKEADYDNA